MAHVLPATPASNGKDRPPPPPAELDWPAAHPSRALFGRYSPGWERCPGERRGGRGPRQPPIKRKKTRARAFFPGVSLAPRRGEEGTPGPRPAPPARPPPGSERPRPPRPPGGAEGPCIFGGGALAAGPLSLSLSLSNSFAPRKREWGRPGQERRESHPPPLSPFSRPPTPRPLRRLVGQARRHASQPVGAGRPGGEYRAVAAAAGARGTLPDQARPGAAPPPAQAPAPGRREGRRGGGKGGRRHKSIRLSSQPQPSPPLCSPCVSLPPPRRPSWPWAPLPGT